MNFTFSNLNQWFRKPKAQLFAMVLGTGLLSACSTAPESVNFEQQNTNFNRVAQAPDSFVGNQVRWGGIVARVENLERDTLVEIVNLPLDSRARPIANQNTGGRFIARLQGFVDPLIYKQGKEITVVGVLNEPMPGKIGEHPVNFPVVDSSGHHLWEKRPSRVYVTSFSTWDPFWFGHVGYRWRYPYYGYPRYNYCPTHGIFHHHGVRHQVIRTYDNRSNEVELNAAPSPTNVVRPLSDSRPNLDEVDRVTLRDMPKPRNVQPKPVEIRRPVAPATPRRVQPKIHQVKLPKPTAPIRMPKASEKRR